MLYDPQWNEPKPEKPDMFALDTLIGWLEKQEGSYRYSSPRHCLLAQYFMAMTGLTVVVSKTHVHIYESTDDFVIDPKTFPLPEGWDSIALDLWQRRTFKAALKRAKRLRFKAAVGNIFSRVPQLLGLT